VLAGKGVKKITFRGFLPFGAVGFARNHSHRAHRGHEVGVQRILGGVFCLGFEGFVVDYGSKEKEAAPMSGKHHLVRLLGFWTSMLDACNVDLWVGE